MDTMFRKKTGEAQEKAGVEKRAKRKPHVADDYNPKIRPRESHPDAISAERRISQNLDKLNRELVDTPAGEIAYAEDRGDKVVTRAASVTARAPIAMMVTCVLVAAVFMYMLFLSVQVDEYSHSIDVLQSRVAELKEESTQLEVRLESKYDLDEIERIATQQYGMVSGSGLPRKYVSVSEEAQRWEEPVQEEAGAWESFWDSVVSFFGLGQE